MPYSRDMFWALFDDDGNWYGEFRSEAEALAALDKMIDSDPSAADETFVLAFDDEGERVGEPIMRVAAA